MHPVEEGSDNIYERELIQYTYGYPTYTTIYFDDNGNTVIP